MIYEIRNYHFEPTLFEDYKSWARDKALPFLSRELDLVGFWVIEGDSEVTGEPMDAMGSANITWIIRWSDRETRDQTMAGVFTGEEWGEIFATVPGGMGSYKRMEAKFTEDLLA